MVVYNFGVHQYDTRQTHLLLITAVSSSVGYQLFTLFIQKTIEIDILNMLNIE